MKLKEEDLFPGAKVKFIDSYTGYFEKFKDFELTIDCYYSKYECGEPNGRVTIKEIMKEEEYHLINPEWLRKS